MSNGPPRVTTILAEAAISDARWFTEASRDRGTAMHLCCELDDLGDLDEESVDPIVAPFLASYRKFKAEVRPIICQSGTTVHRLAIEETVTDHAGRFVGHLDRRYLIGGAEYLVDIKSLVCTRSHRLQTAFYAMPFRRSMKRACLHLSPDGYKWIEHASRFDYRACEAILTLRAWEKESECKRHSKSGSTSGTRRPADEVRAVLE